MGKQKSLRSKAVHFVSDLTTVFLNPISDKPSKHPHRSPPPPPPHPTSEDISESKRSQLESIGEENAEYFVDGPDTSSFTAFLYSLLSSSESGNNENSDEQKDDQTEMGGQVFENAVRESGSKKSLLSRGKQSLRTVYQIARFGRHQNQEQKVDSDVKLADKNVAIADGLEMKCMENVKESISSPDTSEPSLLLSTQARSILYRSLPAFVQGRKWLLLYSTWRHGISLSTLYRRSMLLPGLSLLVVGDRKGAVFGGLVEAPLRPTNKRKYQGTNSTFVFTDTPGHPVIFCSTGSSSSASNQQLFEFYLLFEKIMIYEVCEILLSAFGKWVHILCGCYFWF
uniref:Oxidation resistance protein 1 n=1 Tax=Rhizophora mucronata TaxID=61149 RepID=A0A2P2K5V6_RHIMU